MLSAGRALHGASRTPQAREPSRASGLDASPRDVTSTAAGLATVEWLRERFADAADTLRRLPKPREFRGHRLQSPWPDTIREWLSYASQETHVRRAAPSPEAITRLEEVLGWMSELLTPDQRMVCWGRAEGLTWRRMEYLDAQVSRRRGNGRQDRQLRNIRDDGEARILSRLNGTPARARISLERVG